MINFFSHIFHILKIFFKKEKQIIKLNYIESTFSIENIMI